MTWTSIAHGTGALWVVLSVVGASLLAGFVDAIVGGGGLVLVPAMFSAFPDSAPATLFGTNKAASLLGTTSAAFQYSRRVVLRWRSLIPITIVAFVGAGLGAWAATQMSPTKLRRLLPFVLSGVFVYSILKREMGKHHRPRFAPALESVVGSACGLSIGFYDGFFGPGTGSFLVFLFVRLLGFDFLHASASAKVINTATNLAALIFFAASDHVWWDYAGVMAVANVVGSLLGSRLALRQGSGFVRYVFIGVVGVLILKTGVAAL